jgi:hypothetical protein
MDKSIDKTMDSKQADAIAEAILEPRLREREEARSRRAREAALDARKRRVAWCSLAGSGLGAAAAYAVDARLAAGIVFGGLAGSAVGWMLTSLGTGPEGSR